MSGKSKKSARLLIERKSCFKLSKSKTSTTRTLEFLPRKTREAC